MTLVTYVFGDYLRCSASDSISLNLNLEFVVLFGIKVRYSLIFFSITLGTMDIE